jgi:hypothetical protein
VTFRRPYGPSRTACPASKSGKSFISPDPDKVGELARVKLALGADEVLVYEDEMDEGTTTRRT